MEEVGKDFCPNFLHPFLDNINRSCNNGSRELIPVFHNPHRKCRPPPSAVARTLEYLVGAFSQATSSGSEKKQVRINIQKTREYIEGGNQVSPKFSPLQGVKAQQSLVEWQVTNISYQLCSFKLLISATRFCEQAGIQYSRCGRTKAPC